jgi:hypothetical protein
MRRSISCEVARAVLDKKTITIKMRMCLFILLLLPNVKPQEDGGAELPEGDWLCLAIITLIEIIGTSSNAKNDIGKKPYAHDKNAGISNSGS